MNKPLALLVVSACAGLWGCYNEVPVPHGGGGTSPGGGGGGPDPSSPEPGPDEPIVGVDGSFNLIGWSADLDGDTAVFGAMYDEVPGVSHGGAAYVLVRGADGVWAPQATLRMSDPLENSFFGISVAVDGDTIAVGATHGTDTLDTPNSGAVYVFKRAGTTWTQQAKLSELDGGVFKSYGYSVSLDGNTLAVGSRYNDHSGITDAGAVYVYTRSGAVWSLQSKLTAPDARGWDVFGFASALEGNVLAVGAYQHDENSAGDRGGEVGAVYVYRRTGTTWAFEQQLVAPASVAGDWLGYSVAMTGNTIVAGMPGASRGGVVGRGAFHTFSRIGGVWLSQGTTLVPSAHVGDGLGDSIEIEAGRVVVGGSKSTVSGLADAGAISIFSGTPGAWAFSRQLTQSSPGAHHEYGYALGLSGSTLTTIAPAPGSADEAVSYALELD